MPEMVQKMLDNETVLTTDFFDRDAQLVATELLGKVIKHLYCGVWLAATIIETEAYYLEEKASHASLGFTDKRKALFMPAGTIYMYYARGSDSLNISVQGSGNAVLIKSGFPYVGSGEDETQAREMLGIMQQLNPKGKNNRLRKKEELCAGQTLLCKSLNLKVVDWDQKTLDENKLRIVDVGYKPENIIQTTRLGIPVGRDEHLPYRFIDGGYVRYSTCKGNSTKSKKTEPYAMGDT